MRADLRPSSLGEILDRTAQMYRRHFLLYAGIASISYAVVLVLSLATNALLFSHLPGRSLSQLTGLRLMGNVGVGLVSILPTAVAMAAIMHAVATNYLGQNITIAQAYGSLRRLWYRPILILLAIYFYALLPTLAVVAGAAALAAAVPASFGRNLAIGIMVMVVFLGFLVAFWWMLRWALAIPVSLMEKLGVHRSLKRSAQLTQDARGRIFVMLLLVIAVIMVIQYAVQIPLIFMLFHNKGVATFSTQVVGACGTFLSGSFVMPIYSIALTLLYYDQRIRKEAYDVEWLMEQAAEPQAHVNAPPAARHEPSEPAV